MNIEAIRNYNLSLPASYEELKWGNNLCFLVINKIFCIINLDKIFACAVKVPKEEFDDLLQNQSSKI